MRTVLPVHFSFKPNFADSIAYRYYILLIKMLIDHWTTSQDHPQSDGLVERMVQVVMKRRLYKSIASPSTSNIGAASSAG
jgi:hypothetical protein